MTTKQIAEAVGQTDRSVRNWVRALAEKSSAIAEKLAASSPAKPADYTLAESCHIIEEGLGKAAADVYRTNAVNAELANKASLPKSPKLPNGIQMTALCRLYERKAISAGQVQVLLGVASRVPEAIPSIPESVASPEVAEAEFSRLHQFFDDKSARQAHP